MVSLDESEVSFEKMPDEFTIKEFSDKTIRFILDGEKVTVMQSNSPGGTYEYKKK